MALPARFPYPPWREAQAIVRCVRHGFDPTAHPAEEAWVEGMDWEWLIETARRHRVAPYVRDALRSSDGPAGPRKELERLCHEDALLGGMLTRALVDVVSMFTENGIRVLAFKGPVAAADIYGAVGSRPFGDIDLLVHRRDIHRAGRVLRGLGYSMTGQYQWETVYQRELAEIDVHRTLSPPPLRVALPFDRLWAGRRTVTIRGAPVPTFSLEHLVIILCVQLAKDAAESRVRLIKVCDLAVVLRHKPIDWHAIVNEATSIGCLGILSFGLTLTEHLLGARLVDPALLQNLTGVWDTTDVADRAAAHLFDPLPQHVSFASMRSVNNELREHRRDRLYGRMYPGPSVRALLHFTVIPNEKDRAMVSLPPALDPLYYVLRPLRLLHDAVSRIRPTGRTQRPR